MSGVTRTAIITYNGWATNSTGADLDGFHTIDETKDQFSCEFDVILSGANAATLLGYEQAMIAALNTKNKEFKIAVGGSTFKFFDADLGAVDGSAETAQEITARWRLLTEPQSATVRRYRIEVTVQKAAHQTIDGIQSETVTVSQSVRDVKSFTYEVEYTPDYNSDTDAYSVYSSGSGSFATRVSAFQTVLGGTWERVGPIELDYDTEDHTDTRFLTAKAEYREKRDTVTISYNGWTTADTGFALWQTHTLSEDQDTFSVEFDVTVTAASHAQMVTYTGTMIAALKAEHKRLKIYKSTDTYYDFDANLGSVAGAVTAQSIKANWRLDGEDRADLVRVYRIRFDVSKSASQSGKTALREQTITVDNLPSGGKLMTLRVVYTPNPGSDTTALAMYSDATYGFANLASGFQTILTGTWEQVGPIRQEYDEDSRGLVATGSYKLILYAQLAGDTNSSRVVDIQYDVSLERPNTQGVDGLQASPLSTCTVTFSALCPTGNDIKTVIDSYVVPYVRSTVAAELNLNGTLVTAFQNIRGNPVTREIGGLIRFYVRPTGDLLNASFRQVDQVRTGDTLRPVLDKTRWSRNLHEGPGQWLRRVVIGATAIGSGLGVVQSYEANVIASQKALGFHFMGWSVDSSPVTERFNLDGTQIVITTQVRILEFEYGRLVNTGQVGDSQVRESGGGAAGLIGHQERR